MEAGVGLGVDRVRWTTNVVRQIRHMKSINAVKARAQRGKSKLSILV